MAPAGPTLQPQADGAVRTLEELIGRKDLPALTAYAAKEMYPALDPLQDVLGKRATKKRAIGKWPHMGVAEARKAARDQQRQHSRAQHPQQGRNKGDVDRFHQRA